MKYVSGGRNSKTRSNIITSDDDWRFTPRTNVTVATERRSLACWLTWVWRSSWIWFRSDWILMTPPFPFVVKFAVEMKMWSKDKQESKRANQPLEKAGRKETPGLPWKINAPLVFTQTALWIPQSGLSYSCYVYIRAHLKKKEKRSGSIKSMVALFHSVRGRDSLWPEYSSRALISTTGGTCVYTSASSGR